MDHLPMFPETEIANQANQALVVGYPRGLIEAVYR
jgi:hypothetical protein